MISRLLRVTVLAVLFVSPAQAVEYDGSDDGWQFDPGVYLWASNITAGRSCCVDGASLRGADCAGATAFRE